MNQLEERIAWLEAANRATLEALDLAGGFGDYQQSLNTVEDPRGILEEAASRLGALLSVETLGFYLIHEEDADFYPACVQPDEASAALQLEMDAQVASGHFAYALNKRQAIIVSARTAQFAGREVMLHDLSTTSRIRGMCLAVLDQSAQHIPDATLKLVSFLLRSTANGLESQTLYSLIRAKNETMAQQVVALTASELALSQRRQELEQVVSELEKEISERRAAEREAMTAELRYRSLFEHAGTAMCIAQQDGSIKLVNTYWEELTGRRRNELEQGMHVDAVLGPAAWERAAALAARHAVTTAHSLEINWTTPSGQKRDVALTAAPIPETRETLLSMVDISDLRQAKRSLKLQEAHFRAMFDNAPVAIASLEPDGKVRHVNPGFSELFGYAERQLQGMRLVNSLVPQDLHDESKTMQELLRGGQSVHFDTIRRHKDGHGIPVHVTAYPVQVGGKLDSLCFTYSDMSERKRYEEQLAYQAFHDALTGLPNRSLLLERLQRCMERACRRGGYRYGLLLVDLDRFKTVNDSLGHHAGDTLLVEISQRLTQCVRGVDTVARLGGDEFAILLEEFDHPKEVVAVARRIQKALGAPILVENSRVYSSASIGIVIKTKPYQGPSDVLRDADIAMYKAKARGGGQFRIFNRTMHHKTMDMLQLETDLRQAVHNGALQLVYQPIFSLPGRRLDSFEALLRWPHPKRGLMPPDTFIHVAEESGCILAVGHWVIREACRQLMQWRRAFGAASLVPVSVNVSGIQLRQPDFIDGLQEALADFNVSPQHLKVEITESTMLDDAPRMASVLRKCKDMGVRLMLDDFGMGYSSLSQLHHFSLDFLKIDKSFISGAASGNGAVAHAPLSRACLEGKAAGLPQTHRVAALMAGEAQDQEEEHPMSGKGQGNGQSDAFSIARTIISLGQAMGMQVVAEGVEREEQVQALEALQCHAAQGWFFSKPLTATVAGNMLRA